MTTIVIDRDETFVATSRKQSVTVNVLALSPAILANIFDYGLQQVMADAASGAVKDAAEGAGVVVGDYKDWSKTQAARDWSMSEAGVKAIAESTVTMMSKKADALIAGEWSTRGEGSGVSTETRIGRSLMRGMMKAKADSRAWATFTGLSDAAQNEKIDANIAKNADAMAMKVKAEIARLEALRAAKAKIAEGMDIAL